VSVVIFYSRSAIAYDESLEFTVFSLANDVLAEVCTRHGLPHMSFVRGTRPAIARRPRSGTSKVWESAKQALTVPQDKRSEEDVESIIKFSKRLPFFKYVSTGAREALCRTMQHVVLEHGEPVIKGPEDLDFVWYIVIKGRCDMMLKTEEGGKHYAMRAFEESDTLAYSYVKMLTGGATNIVGDIRAGEPNTSVVRVCVQEEHRGDFRSQTKPLLYEELAEYFNMSADQAAERLGVCMSAIKKICRRHGIIRWPHRKLLSANKSLALIDTKMNEYQSPQQQALLRAEAINVLVLKLRVMLNPTYIVQSELIHVNSSRDGNGNIGTGVLDADDDASLSPGSGDEGDEPGGKRHRSQLGGSSRKGKKARGNVGMKNGRVPPPPDPRGMQQGGVMLQHQWGGHGGGMMHGQMMPGQMDPRALQSLQPGGQVSMGPMDGGVGQGDMSIEQSLRMVQQSIEGVPAHAREQVLSQLLSGMQRQKAGGGAGDQWGSGFHGAGGLTGGMRQHGSEQKRGRDRNQQTNGIEEAEQPDSDSSDDDGVQQHKGMFQGALQGSGSMDPSQWARIGGTMPNMTVGLPMLGQRGFDQMLPGHGGLGPWSDEKSGLLSQINHAQLALPRMAQAGVGHQWSGIGQGADNLKLSGAAGWPGHLHNLMIPGIHSSNGGAGGADKRQEVQGVADGGSAKRQPGSDAGPGLAIQGRSLVNGTGREVSQGLPEATKQQKQQQQQQQQPGYVANIHLLCDLLGRGTDSVGGVGDSTSGALSLLPLPAVQGEQ